MCIESESLPRCSCLKCIEKRMMAADLCNQLPLFSGRSIYFATFCHLSLFQLDNYVPIVLPAQRRGSTRSAFQPVPLPSPLASNAENHIRHILIRPPNTWTQRPALSGMTQLSQTPTELQHFHQAAVPLLSLPLVSSPLSFPLFSFVQNHIHTTLQLPQTPTNRI